jgi:hypothetical protein
MSNPAIETWNDVPVEERRTILVRAQYLEPICPYNRYLNENQRLMMEALGYTDLQPCLLEHCEHYQTTWVYAGASRDTAIPYPLRPIGLSAHRVTRCQRQDACDPSRL